MSAPHPNALVGPRPVLDAALRGIDASAERARALLDGVVGLARQEAGLALRLAMVLAWIKQQDVGELGYSSFTAFCRENVSWGGSWLRDMVRLVCSPLDQVKAAACRGLVPMRLAVKAPGRVAPKAQAEWLLDPHLDEAPRRVLERFDGDDAAVVHRARSLARLFIGRPASMAAVDAFILDRWRAQVPAEVVLEQARQAPARPESTPLSWGWVDDGAPAEALVGPWAPPASLREALQRVAHLERLRAGRAATLARGWAMVDHHALWLEAGFASPWDFAAEVLGWSRRTAQRHKKLGWALQWWPELDRAVEEGLDLGAVAMLASVVEATTVSRWVAVARRVGRLELARATREAAHGHGVLEVYEQAIAQADAWAADGGAPTAGGPLRVALPHGDEPPSTEVRGPHGLVEASRWFVEQVQVPPQRGFGKVKERDGYTCQNPECGRRALRNEAHHLLPRSEGGPDTLENGTTTCRVCHLRGVHTNDEKIRVGAVDVGGRAALLWEYVGGRRVLVFLEPAARGG